MECKNCHADLPEDVTLCPACGCDNAPQAEEAAPAQAAEETPAAPAEEAPAASEEAIPPEVEDFLTPPAPINKKKLALVIAGVLAVIALLVCGIYFGTRKPAEPEATLPPETTLSATEPSQTEPGTNGTETTEPVSTFVPTMTPEEAAAAMQKASVVMGSAQLTNGQLSSLYWMTVYETLNMYYNYGLSPEYLGIDVNQPLKDQPCMMAEEDMSWEDYFLGETLEYWAECQAMALAAQEAGYVLDQETQDNLDNVRSQMEASAAYYGFETVDDMILADFGHGVTFEDYMHILTIMTTNNRYYEHLTVNLEVTDEDAATYFDENPAMFENSDIRKDDTPSSISVRHILIIPEGEPEVDEYGETSYTQEQMAQAWAKAQDILDQWAAGEATEESFAALAGEYSEDPGSVNNGGLYEDVLPGQMVVPFNDWCFNPERQVGDTGLVETSYGVHVMYFSAVTDPTPYWLGAAKTQLMSEKLSQMVEDIKAAHPYEIHREDVVISEVNLAESF